jgi:hypothetical protein
MANRQLADQKIQWPSLIFESNMGPFMRLILASDQSKNRELSARLKSLSPKEKMTYAAKKFFLFFGLAVISVFIPVAHFVLVPVFLLLAIVTGVRANAIKYKLELREDISCLKCEKTFPREFLLGKEMRLQCRHCFEHFQVEE